MPKLGLSTLVRFRAWRHVESAERLEELDSKEEDDLVLRSISGDVETIFRNDTA